MTPVWKAVRRLVDHNEAATMVEYALMIALIAIVCFVAVQTVGSGANSLFALAASMFP